MYKVCRDNRQTGPFSNCGCLENKFKAFLAHMLTGEVTANGKQIFVSGNTKFSMGFLLPLIAVHVVKSTF
jgi:hypothetical protein